MEEGQTPAQPSLGNSSISALDPLQPLHETEVTLGLAAGTRGRPLEVQISAALLGGWIQWSFQIEEEDI